jgi:pSer/pThr/pTyr-binding forkhead associated (FHA) protein/EAL domain-containing protein (putative c-di-GMP-specific phosphodiesterase class I)
MGLVVSPISLASIPPSAPRLEYFQNGSTELHRVTIEHSPFKIGRCETSDLRIDSAEVSREHAQIYQRGNIWSIRDLGSTNGTQVNGQPIQESVLSDGDILAIAETELTFVASPVTPFQRMVTQPIRSRESAKLPALLPSEIAQLRVLTEATLWQAIPLHLATVVALSSGLVEAYFAQLAEATNLGDSEHQLNPIHAVGKRFFELARLRAIEMAQAQPAAHRIFVTANLAEFESPAQLFFNLEQLRDQIALNTELGVTIALPKTLDPSTLLEVSREVRKAGILLGFVNFQGSIAQVVDLASCAPDYLILSDTMLNGLAASSRPLSRLELVLTTCQELGIKAVLPHCACQNTIAQCRQLGYEFAVHAVPSNDQFDERNVVASSAPEPRHRNDRIELEVS